MPRDPYTRRWKKREKVGKVGKTCKACKVVLDRSQVISRSSTGQVRWCLAQSGPLGPAGTSSDQQEATATKEAWANRPMPVLRKREERLRFTSESTSFSRVSSRLVSSLSIPSFAYRPPLQPHPLSPPTLNHHVHCSFRVRRCAEESFLRHCQRCEC